SHANATPTRIYFEKINNWPSQKDHCYYPYPVYVLSYPISILDAIDTLASREGHNKINPCDFNAK
ncbi:hypothetical protein ABTO87_18245, partial [Acinetobacter baumannii]